MLLQPSSLRPMASAGYPEFGEQSLIRVDYPGTLESGPALGESVAGVWEVGGAFIGPGAFEDLGDGIDQALPAAARTSERCHIGLRPGLVDEDQGFGVDAGLTRLPAGASPSDIGPVGSAIEGRAGIKTSTAVPTAKASNEPALGRQTARGASDTPGQSFGRVIHFHQTADGAPRHPVDDERTEGEGFRLLYRRTIPLDP